MSRTIPCEQPLCCPRQGEEHDATHVVQWRTDQMAMPGFWYVCAVAAQTLFAEMASVESVRLLKPNYIVSLEVEGCRYVYDNEERFIQTCPDSEAMFWTLYERGPDHLAYAIIDCPTRAYAEFFKETLIRQGLNRLETHVMVAKLRALQPFMDDPTYPIKTLTAL